MKEQGHLLIGLCGEFSYKNRSFTFNVMCSEVAETTESKRDEQPRTTFLPCPTPMWTKNEIFLTKYFVLLHFKPFLLWKTLPFSSEISKLINVNTLNNLKTLPEERNLNRCMRKHTFLRLFFTTTAYSYTLFCSSGSQFCCVGVLPCKRRILHMSPSIPTFSSLVNMLCFW